MSVKTAPYANFKPKKLSKVLPPAMMPLLTYSVKNIKMIRPEIILKIFVLSLKRFSKKSGIVMLSLATSV